jgi:DNA primase
MVRAKRKINQFTNYSNNYLMDIQTAKQIRIADYLHSLGYSPVKQQGINLWYKSPLREETEASFKVNIERNQWYDFALGKGGTIELASHLYATDHIPYILERIAEQTPHIRPDSFSFGKQSSSEPRFQQLEIVPLSSPALLSYLQERGINTELAKRECREAHFTNNGKRYFAIAFPNISGGYEIRNRYFKGCIAPKKSPTSDRREKRGKRVMCSRDLWTIFHFLL